MDLIAQLFGCFFPFRSAGTRRRMVSGEERKRLGGRGSDEGNAHCPSGASRSLTVPVVGFEILEERPKHTVYKLKVENTATNEVWIVFRRYTDFLRLHKQILEDFPEVRVDLPPKRILGDNFDESFLEERAHLLNDYLNEILNIKNVANSDAVSKFFCLGNGQLTSRENLEKCRAMCEVLEDKVFELEQKLDKKDLEIDVLRAKYQLLKAQNDLLVKLFRKSEGNPNLFAALKKHTNIENRSREKRSGHSHSMTDCRRRSSAGLNETFSRETPKRVSSSNCSVNYKFRRSFICDSEVIRESGEVAEMQGSRSVSPGDSAVSTCSSNNNNIV